MTVSRIAEPDRILSRDEVNRLVTRLMSFVKTPADGTAITIQGWWQGELRWARNRVSLASDRRDLTIAVDRRIGGNSGVAITNQTDDVSLEAAVRAAERNATNLSTRSPDVMPVTPPVLPMPDPTIWSEATYTVTADQRAKLARELVNGSEGKDLLSAGYIEMRAAEYARLEPDSQSPVPGVVHYNTYTQAQCSMTVRHPKGVGSGWAGLSSYDWAAINSGALAETALQKCLTSLNPVAIEPGRYTVILEPQAVADIMEEVMMSLNKRSDAENGQGPFYLDLDRDLGIMRSKLGLKVLDDRISISHDPADRSLGLLPREGLLPVNWVERGVLTALSNNFRTYGVKHMNENLPEMFRLGYRMSGGESTIDDMISTTKRGLLVTRFSGLILLDGASLLLSGVTRDGLWLIENGKISKAVKNMRITESPLFALNRVEQLGVPVPVFRPVKSPYYPELSPAIVPPIKANDFSFTSMVDAV